jgi:hypothetical protein
MNLPTVDQALASSRHAVSFLMGAATAFGITSVQGVDLTTVNDSLGHIFNGIKEISIGAGPLITIAMGWWAAHKSSAVAQVTAAAAVPGVSVKVSPAASPEVKAVAADPSQPKVTSA